MNIDALVNRPRMYAMEDGLAELALGLTWLITGSAFLVLHVLPKGSSAAKAYLFVAQAIWVSSSLVFAWGLKKLKERVTYPRGGFVGFDHPWLTSRTRVPVRAVLVLLLILISAFVGMFAFFVGPTFRPGNFNLTLASGLAMMLALIYIAGGIRYRLAYMISLGGFSAALGSWVYLKMEGDDSIPFVLLWEGVALAAVGGVKLWRFVKANPRPTRTEG